MDNMFDTGLATQGNLGDAYVDKTFEAADDFNRPFQEAMTAWCWGSGWGDDAIDAKTRSMMNLAMIGALGKMHEWELVPRRHQERCDQRRIAGHHTCDRHLLQCAAGDGMFRVGPQGTRRAGWLTFALRSRVA